MALLTIIIITYFETMFLMTTENYYDLFIGMVNDRHLKWDNMSL